MKLLRAGRKKCTIRLGLATVATPEIKMSDGRSSVSVRIVKVDDTRKLNQLTDADARDEGFSSREGLRRGLRPVFPRANDCDPITGISFQPVTGSSSVF